MTETEEADGFGIYPREILAMLYRRRLWLIIAIVAGFVAGCAAVYLQQPLYRSSATLLIDSQAIPTTLVASPLTDIANERIAKIRQQIVSRESLTSLISKNNLYAEERKSLRMDDVLNVMRGAITVDLVGANQANNGEGTAIAFTLSFTYKDAERARLVTKDLADLFLVEDKRFRTEQASGTASFLGRRSDELRRQLTGLEEKRRSVEASYAGALPNQIGLSAQSSATLRAEISRIDAETQGLVQQNSLLAARAEEGLRAPSPAGEGLRRAEEQLNQLSAVYADTYPEVVKARAAVERQRAALRGQADGPSGLIQNEIAAGRARIAMLAQRRSHLLAELGSIDQRSAQAPQAAYELTTIEREYDNLKRQYETLREKQLDAQVAANLQSEDKGERFSIIDEPSFPHEPVGRKAFELLAMCLIGGLGLGVGSVLVLELMAGTIHGEGSLSRVLSAPVLGSVPIMKDQEIPGGLRAAAGRFLPAIPFGRGTSYARRA